MNLGGIQIAFTFAAKARTK